MMQMGIADRQTDRQTDRLLFVSGSLGLFLSKRVLSLSLA